MYITATSAVLAQSEKKPGQGDRPRRKKKRVEKLQRKIISYVFI